MFQITLKAARISCGYTEREVAEYCGIITEVYEQYEKDAGEMPASVAAKIHKLFGISLDALYID